MFDANGNPLFVGLTVGGTYVDGYYANWGDLDRLERRVDYAGNATLNRYNGQGHLLHRTGADGHTLGFDNDALGRALGAYNEEGHRVSISRDGEGRERSVTDPNCLTTAFEYHDAAHAPCNLIDPLFKRQLTQTHDDWDRLLSRTVALSRTWRPG